jgi:hypothetical protein
MNQRESLSHALRVWWNRFSFNKRKFRISSGRPILTRYLDLFAGPDNSLLAHDALTLLLRAILHPSCLGKVYLAAYFYVAATRLIGVRVICQEIPFFGKPVFFFWVKVHVNMGCTFFLDTARLVVVVAYSIGKVPFAYVDGNQKPLSFFFENM